MKEESNRQAVICADRRQHIAYGRVNAVVILFINFSLQEMAYIVLAFVERDLWRLKESPNLFKIYNLNYIF